MFHTVALSTTITAADGLKSLSTITDTVFAPSGNGFLLPADFKLVAAYCGNFQIARARITAPSLARVGYPLIRPVQPSASTGLSAAPVANPNLMTLLDGPIVMRAGEAVGVDGATRASSTDRITAILWFADRIDPVPQGDSFWLRFTSSTVLAANAWTVVSPSFDQAFPSGTYAITGVEYTSPGATAARLVLPGSVLRPGVLAQVGSIAAGATNSGSARTHAIFYDGSLGVFGLFQTSAPPSIEVLSISADAADTQEGYLRVVRIGDVGATSAMTGPGPLMPSSHGAILTQSGATLTPSPGGTKGR